MPPKLHWINDMELTVGDTNLLAAELADVRSTGKRLALFKWRWMVEVYYDLLGTLEPENIIELGICEGGSTAFLAAVASPKKLVAIELDPTPNQALASHLEQRGLSDSVKPYYGIDQTDRQRIEEILASEYGAEELDLVVDDASHSLEPTRRSFNTLFPRLRTGGVYVIEDWPWTHVGKEIARGSLTTLLFELLMACTVTEGLIANIDVDRNMIRVRRGELRVDPDSFDLTECYDEFASEIVEHLERASFRRQATAAQLARDADRDPG